MVRESKLFREVSNFFILNWAKTKVFFKLHFSKGYREKMELKAISLLWNENDPNYKSGYAPYVTKMDDIKDRIVSSSYNGKDNTFFKRVNLKNDLQKKRDVYCSYSDELDINVKSNNGLDEKAIGLLKDLEKLLSTNVKEDDKDE